MSRKYIAIILFIIASTGLWAGETKSHWLINFDQALEQAKKDPQKKIFILFTGSDWCPACIQLHDTILNKNTFKKYATKNLILVKIDFPKRKPQMPIQKKINEKLAENFNVDGYPTMFLLDRKGKVLKTIDFRGQTPKGFVKELENPDNSPGQSTLTDCDSCGNLTPVGVYNRIKIPPADKIHTQDEFMSKKYAWVKKFFVTHPQASGKISKEVADCIDNYYRNCFEIGPYPGWDDICQTARKLYDKGIDSPYFLACYIGMVDQGKDRKYYRKVMRKLLNKLLYDKSIPSYLLFRYAINTGRKPSRYVERWVEKGDFKNVPPQVLYRFIFDYCYGNTNQLDKIVKKLKEVNADPWLQKTVSGILEWQRAWDSRGGGFAYTVTKSGWNGFSHHGKLAYKNLTEAHALHPERPEAAAELVYVCSCQKSETETIEWFNKAIAAQADLKGPWRSLMWGLRPRWGGSWKKMLALGKRASEVDNKFYHTLIPMVYLWSILDVAGEMDYLKRKRFMKKMLPEVTRVLIKKKDANLAAGAPKLAKEIYAILAKYQLLCGEYALAKKNLELAGPDFNGYTTLGCNNSYLQASRAEMNEEIKLATGPHADEIKQIDELVESGKNIEAAQKFVEIMKKMKTKSGKEFAKNKAVNYFLIKKDYISKNDTGIFALARGSSIEGVKAFLDAGCKVNCRGKDNCTLLQRSLKKDSDYRPDSPVYAKMKIDMLKFLLSRGADINALAGPKWTALHLSISNRLPIPVVDFILKQKGVDINCGDCDKETPLMWCAMLNLTKQAQFLLSKGADPNLKDRRGKRAIDYAKSDEMRRILTSI